MDAKVMAKRSELVSMVRRAISSHIRWRAYAQGLVAGVPVTEDKLPVAHTECRFGKWYFGEGMSAFGHLQIFKDIQGPHETLHAVYAQIHELVSRQRLAEAEAKLAQLTAISRTLIEQLELLEAEVGSR